MYKAVIFDMDGTTTNTLSAIVKYANYALEKNGLPAIDAERYKYLVGNGAETLAERMVKEAGADASAADAVYNTYMEAYRDNYVNGAFIYDGIKELTDALKAKGLKVGILSNRPHEQTAAILNELFGENYFSITAGAVDGVPLKPDPSALCSMMEKLGIKKSECLYVGDTSTDIQTGKRAGVFTVGVAWGFRAVEELLENGADAIAEKPSEILELAVKD